MTQNENYQALVGNVFNIQRYSTHDGPGIRTTVFLKGCPLRCFWCQNPESQSMKPLLMFKRDRCTRCGRCLKTCPVGANEIVEGQVYVDRDKCTACGACVKTCFAKARSIEGRKMTVAEVIGEVKKDRMLYQNSGGGMTVSGGACEMQPDFTVGLMRAAHDEGIRTAAEMEGAFPWEIVRRIAEHTDYVLFDLKCMDDKRHKAGTAVSNVRILENAKNLVQMGKTIKFRTPLIPGFNDDRESIAAIAHFVRDELGLSPAEHLELLAYNNLGEEKYVRLDFEGVHPKYQRQSQEYIDELNALRCSI